MLNYSTSEENYIKTIFHLQNGQNIVTTNELAEKLNTKPASVTDMMKKLKAKKLLHYQPYQGFRLSHEGKKVALDIIRRHRLWEYFLAEKLKFKWDEVHAVAEDLFPAEGGGTVAEATCGVVSLAVRGAVLAPVIEGRMSSTTTMSYVQVGGRQRLERFEGEPREALEASFGGGPFEQAGLSLSVTQTSAEPIEINWFV